MRWEQTGKRSLAFSQWHRETFDDQSDAFDVDLMGICEQPRCRTPLYAIEETRSATKATTMLEGLCATSHTPGIVVYFEENEAGRLMSLHARLVWPERHDLGDEKVLAAYLRALRNQHRRGFHLEKFKQRQAVA